jgi:hypothetical protein
LVVTDDRPHGATYLYLPGESQPYLRFNGVDEAKRYIENRTEGPAGAHAFAMTYFSRNDALGNWNAVLPGVEALLNGLSEARQHPKQQDHHLLKFNDPLLAREEKLIQNQRDVTDDPFGKQVDTAKEKALDQADFDITSEADKADKNHYDEVGKYRYIPFSELLQLLYAKTGEQKRDVLSKLAIDAITTVVAEGAGKAFAPLARNVVRLLGEQKPKLPDVMPDDDAPLPPTEKSRTAASGSGSPPDPAPAASGGASKPVPVNQELLPPAAKVSEKDLQPYGRRHDIVIDGQGKRYWHDNGKYYQIREDAQPNRPGSSIYKLVDPANPYAFDAPVLMSDGKGGLVPGKMGLAGGSDDIDLDFLDELPDEVEEENPLDRIDRENAEFDAAQAQRAQAAQTQAPGRSASTSGSSASNSGVGASSSTAGPSSSGAGTSAAGSGASTPEQFSSTFALGVTKGFAQRQIALGEVTTLPKIPYASSRPIHIGKTTASGDKFIYNRVTTTGADRDPYSVVKTALEDSGYKIIPITIPTRKFGNEIPCLKAIKGDETYYVYPRRGAATRFYKGANEVQSTQPIRTARNPGALPELVAVYCADTQGNSGYIYFGQLGAA